MRWAGTFLFAFLLWIPLAWSAEPGAETPPAETLPAEPAPAATPPSTALPAEAPPAAATPATPPPAAAEPMTADPPHFRVGLVGIHDERQERSDARELEQKVLTAAQNWTGFELATPALVAANIGEDQRILVLTSRNPAETLVPIASVLNADFALTGAVRDDQGHALLRLRLIHLPDAYECWTDEAPVDTLSALLAAARNELYAQANRRNTSHVAVIAHTPPEAVSADTPISIEANVLATGTFRIDLYYRHLAPGARPMRGGWSMTSLAYDVSRHVYRVTLPGYPAGRLQYYFWLGDDNLNKFGEDGNEAAPIELPIMAPVPPPVLKPPPAAQPPPVTTSAHRISLLTKVLLGVGGAGLITGISLGAATHVLHVGNITEVQAHTASSYAAPTYVVLSLSGAVTLAGGALFGWDWFHQADNAGQDVKPQGK